MDTVKPVSKRPWRVDLTDKWALNSVAVVDASDKAVCIVSREKSSDASLIVYAVNELARPAKTGRWHYRREHEHPMGWSCRDSKTGEAVAYGDKNLVFALAMLLNNDGESAIQFIKGWESCFDYSTKTKKG